MCMCGGGWCYTSPTMVILNEIQQFVKNKKSLGRFPAKVINRYLCKTIMKKGPSPFSSRFTKNQFPYGSHQTGFYEQVTSQTA